jgi:trk system potassium uptake protein TrkH
VLVANLLVAAAAVFALLLTEGRPAVATAYEVFSALGTVGLSLGMTPQLSASGKLLIVLVMFYGRVGPLAVAYGLVRPTREHGVRLPASRMMVG